MPLVQWHAWPLPLVLTLVGDLLCVGLAAFGDATRRYHMPHIFWWILWIAQIPLAVEVASGAILFLGGARPRTTLHLMYGGMIILTLAALHGLRPGGWVRRVVVKDERGYRESRWLLALCLFLAALVGRAYMSGALGR
jgi:hypothetical protein